MSWLNSDLSPETESERIGNYFRFNSDSFAKFKLATPYITVIGVVDSVNIVKKWHYSYEITAHNGATKLLIYMEKSEDSEPREPLSIKNGDLLFTHGYISNIEKDLLKIKSVDMTVYTCQDCNGMFTPNNEINLFSLPDRTPVNTDYR